ncbi:MAG TPA: response regulator [Armatimonadota bacterium]|jgi:CheY-like chemotaxis protein
MALVLVVEDNEINMELACDLLEAAGHQVRRAFNGEEAVAIAGAELPDLILMDVQMPGMDGLEATRRLKHDVRTRHIPIIALTARAMAGEKEMILSAGCDGYISKPIDTRAFAPQVAEALAAGANNRAS